jgi:chromosome segregation ATPase
MSDSDNEDIFDRLAASKYSAQADLSEDESPFRAKKAGKVKAPVKREQIATETAHESDSDLEDLAAEVSAVDQARVAKLREDIQKWESVRAKARAQNPKDPRIAKVTKKLQALQEELGKASQTSHAQDKEIQKLEREIQELESEKLALEQKITAKAARLRQLKPHVAKEDYLNDPSQLGGRIVDGKFIEDDDDGEDDYQQLSSMIAARRAEAQRAGQYNAESGHVKITNPKPTTDNNAGF